MGTDAPESVGFTVTPGNNVYINLEPDTRAETERLFNALAAGGKIEMPLQEMFWGDYFGSWLTASASIGCSTAPAKPDTFPHHGRAPSHTGDIIMRFMILVKATKDSEVGVMPSTDIFAEKGRDCRGKT